MPARRLPQILDVRTFNDVQALLGVVQQHIQDVEGIANSGGTTIPTVYVGPDGSDDSGSGTAANPFRSLERAATAINATGAERADIVVLPGDYRADGISRPMFDTEEAPRHIVIRGAGRDSTKLSAVRFRSWEREDEEEVTHFSDHDLTLEVHGVAFYARAAVGEEDAAVETNALTLEVSNGNGSALILLDRVLAAGYDEGSAAVRITEGDDVGTGVTSVYVYDSDFSVLPSSNDSDSVYGLQATEQCNIYAFRTLFRGQNENAFRHSGNNSMVVLTGCNLYAQGDGAGDEAAVWLSGATGTVQLDHCTVSPHNAGDAVHIDSDSTLVIRDLTVVGTNQPINDGGASATVYLARCAYITGDPVVTTGFTPVWLDSGGQVAYTAGQSNDWATAPPTTITEAIDRLASLCNTLNSNPVP